LNEVLDGIVMYRMASACYSDGHCPLIFVVGDGFIQEYRQAPLIDSDIHQRGLSILSELDVARSRRYRWNF